MRKFFNNVHLWLGVGSGLVLFIVCLTGTIYTFKTEIEHLANPSKFYIREKDPGSIIPTDELVHRLEKQYNGKVVSLLIPADPRMNYQIGIKSPGDKENAGDSNVSTQKPILQQTGQANAKMNGGVQSKGDQAEVRPVNLYVNPYSGAIAGEQGGGTSAFFTKVMQLHRWLLMERSTGGVIVGIATIIFILLIISGVVIWFPKRIKNWKRGLKIKFSANWKRINHDLHSALGFYSFMLLLVMALTGLCWSFEWYRNGVSKVLGSKVFKGKSEKPLQSQPVAGNTIVIALGEHIAHANTLFSYPGVVRVSLPEKPTGTISVSKNKVGFFAFSGTDKVQFDRFSGKPVKVERFSDKPVNEQVADSVKPIHTGEIFGLFSKIIYFIVCLMATSLPVTGTIIWINKLRKKNKRKLPAEGLPEVTMKSNSYEAEIGMR